jgi:malonyl-CoA decarboxylase
VSYRNRLSGLLEYRPRRGFRGWREAGSTVPEIQIAGLLPAIDALRGADELSTRHRIAASINQLFLGLDAAGRSEFLGSLSSILFGGDTEQLAQTPTVAPSNSPEAQTGAPVRGAASGSENDGRENDGRENSPRENGDGVGEAEGVPPVSSNLAADEVVFRLSAVAGGFVALAEMNASLSTASASAPGQLGALRTAIRRRLAQVCTADFLELRSVDWNAPAAFLEQLSRFERVHRITSMDDLRDRLDEDRRCFALFHPSLDDQPVAIVWCALFDRVPKGIGEILNLSAETGDPESASTAVFYSISNTHPGLAGLGLGNELILSALDAVSNEFPQISTFVTLSPIPSFQITLRGRLEADPALAQNLGFPRDATDVSRLLSDPVWMRSFEAATFREAALRAAARYLREVNGDPVAHFHLSNGALLDAIHWGADLSDRGIADGAGMMVNYRYDPDRLAARKRVYRVEGRVPISTGIKSLSE